MKFKPIDVLKSVLGQFFMYNHYLEAISQLRKAIKDQKYYMENWEGVIYLILNRELEPGEPLSLLDNDANLPLENNTDEEAYKWLTLMLFNSIGDGSIIDYKDLVKEQ